MKKYGVLILSVVMALAITGCGDKNDEVVETPPEPVVQNVEDNNTDETEETSDPDPEFISGTYTKSDEAEAEPEEEDESGEEEVSDKTAIITVPDLDEAFDLLSEGKCDAVALTINTAEAYVKKSDGKISLSNVYFEQTSKGNNGGNVVAAKKGEESFIEKISTIIKFAEDKGYYQTWSAVAMEDCGMGDSYTAKLAKNAPKSDHPVDDTYMYLLDSSALKKPTLDLSDASGVLKEVLDRKNLVIATSPDFPPAEYKDGDGVIFGREMVLAKYIADCLGVSLEIKEMTFDEVLGSVDKGEADLAISGLGWKEDRADKYELSYEYEKGKTEDTLVVLTENAEEYHSLSDFAGKKIAVQNGSTQQTYVEEQILPLEDVE